MHRLPSLCLAAAMLAARPASAADVPPPDPHAIWTLQDENASISSASVTDRYYTNGLRLSYVSGTDGVPDLLQQVGHALWDEPGQMRVGFDLTEKLYTAANTAAFTPPAGDRPYAGTLFGTLGLYHDTADSRSTLAISAGVIGPWAMGEQLQNGFHDLIGQGHNNGWHDQLRNEPVAEVISARTWRLATGSLFGLETDALPDLAAGLGNLRIYAQTGAVFRIGQGLDSDFGPSRLFPGPSGGMAFTPTRPFAWYVFAGADGQGVARDITLQGNDFQGGPSVKMLPYLGEVEAGVAFIAFGSRLTYTQVMQSQEFIHQKGGPHQFGSLALSVRF